MALKGKSVARKAPAGKRKRGGDDDDKTGGGRKTKNRAVLQFFEDSAAEASDSDDSDFDDYFMEEEFVTEPNIKNEPGKSQDVPVFPKEEEINEEEFDKMMEERYKDGSNFVTYAEDGYENKRSVERNSLIPSVRDPTIWKVKCMVGRERHSAFCLMQKYVDLKSLGTKLQIISAFALDHMKGFIYIEADKQFDVNEACKGLCSIYSSRVMSVPKNEVSHLLSARSKCNEVSEGMWGRVKNGKYKGDLAQIVAVNDARKRATVKLIPRIDLQAMTAKFGGGVSLKKNSTPASRLISASELEEFRPLIQYRRDRDTNKVFEVLDGLMLKDGYLYKKVSTDSLSCLGVTPSEEELLKFKPSQNNESDDLEWLSQLYGVQKKKRIIRNDKGGEKGESSSGSGAATGYELFELVCFGRKDFGVIIGIEKDDSYKILKESPEGPVVVTIQPRELKSGPFDMKFTALDQSMKPISVNDTIKVLEGPSKDRQGIVKQIYRGTIFLYDENETENCGYFCAKSQMCEKIKLSIDACNEKGGESGLPGFDDFTSSPKSPLSPKKPWQATENSREFNRGDKDGMFSVGQTLRIRVGPLKGYLCRVLAIRRSDVTVKLDSQHKVLTVRSEHLSEVRGKSSTMSMSEDPESNSLKPFDLLGTDGCSGGWMDGAGTSAGSDRWNSGGMSAERSAWPSFPASGISLQPESCSANPISSEGNDAKKDEENAAWGSKASSNQNSSWGAAAANEKSSWGAAAANEKSSWGASAANDKAVANSDQVGGWGEGKDTWNKATVKTGFEGSSSNSWNKAMITGGDPAGSSKVSGDSWGKGNLKNGTAANSRVDAAAAWENNKTVSDNQDGGRTSGEPWDKGKSLNGNPASNWGDATAGKNQLDSWGKGKDVVEAGWGKNKSSGVGGDGWNNVGSVKAVENQDKGTGTEIKEGSWGNAVEKWNNRDGSSETKTNWKSSIPASENQTGAWGNAGGSRAQGEAEKNDEANGWNNAKVVSGSQTANWKPAGGSSWSKQPDASAEDDGWNMSKSSGGDQRSGGWNKGRMENTDDTNQQGSWERGKTFGGDHGFGGRRGGGGGRGGGRNQFGRGRSFGQGQSSGWSKGQENNWTNDGTSSGNPSGWNNDQAGGSGGRREDGWKKANASGGDDGSGRNKGWRADGADKEIGESGDKWNSSKPSGGNNGGSWNASKSSDGNGSSGWNKGSNTNEEPSGSKGGGNNWNTGENQSTWGNKSGNWSSPNTVNRDQSSGWNNKFAANKVGETGDHEGDWNKRKAPGENQNTEWKSKANDVGGNKSSGCGSWDIQRASGDNSTGGASGNQDSSWGKKGSWNSGSSGNGENQDSGWGKKSTWNSGAGDAGGNQDSNWGKKSNNWSSGSGDANQESVWGKKSNWNSQNDFGGNQSVAGGSEDQTETFGNTAGGNFRGGFGGRGSSDRGGFRGRGGFGGRGGDRGGFGGRGGDRGGFGGRGGDSGGFGGRGGDRGGFGGRGRSDRGGFGGRDGPDRGGYGGRGRGRRDQSGGWSNRNDPGDDKPSDWNKGAGDGWKNNDGAGTWNHGGGVKQSWNSGSGGTSNQSSGCNQPTEAKEAAGSNALTGGWSKGSGSTNEAGGSRGNNWGPKDASGGGQRSSWDKSTNVKENNHLEGSSNKGANSGTQSGGWNNQGSGWNTGTGSVSGGGSGDQAVTWNKSNPADRAQSSGWNQSKEAEGANRDGEPTNAWGKAATSSWGKGNGGSGKGGW